MIGDIIYVHRRISILEAINMVYDYTQESQQCAYLEDLQGSFSQAFSSEYYNPTVGLCDGLELSIANFYSDSDIFTILLRLAKKYLPLKEFEVFSLAVVCGYRHYGVEVERFNVVHFSGETSNLGKDAKIQITSRYKFLNGGKFSIEHLLKPKFKRDEIAQRAYDQLNSDFGGYNVFKNNCEHFTTWCATDSRDSRQAMWWNEKTNGLMGHFERFKDFLLDTILGEQIKYLRKKAVADEKYSEELIKILINKRNEFEQRLTCEIKKYEDAFYELDKMLNENLKTNNNAGVKQNLLAFANLLKIDLKNANYEAFTKHMENDSSTLIL